MNKIFRPDSGIEQNRELFRKATQFIEKFYHERDFNRQMSDHVDVSAPRPADLDAIRNRNFEIRNFRTFPETNQVTFYVGSTEFILTQDAAEYILSGN